MTDPQNPHGPKNLAFDVRLLPHGRSQFSARPKDFVVVRVLAPNHLGAVWHDDVRALVAKGFSVCETLPAGQGSQLMAAACARARDALDEAPADMRGANSSSVPGVPNFRGSFGTGGGR